MSRAARPLEERFWEKADKSGECWEWTSTKTAGGYGMFTLRRGSTRCAHRVAYELTVGEIPAGLDIDHICRNRGCVRPEHLRTATRKQNTENLSGARSDSKSGIRGVRRDRIRNRWRVTVISGGVRYDGGSFKDLKQAEAAAIALRNKVMTHNDADRTAATLEVAA